MCYPSQKSSSQTETGKSTQKMDKKKHNSIVSTPLRSTVSTTPTKLELTNREASEEQQEII